MSTRDEPLGRINLLQGTLDVLILRILLFGPQHGQDIARAILLVDHGSLDPALQRLEARGWIAARWGTSAHNGAIPKENGGAAASDLTSPSFAGPSGAAVRA